MLIQINIPKVKDYLLNTPHPDRLRYSFCGLGVDLEREFQNSPPTIYPSWTMLKYKWEAKVVPRVFIVIIIIIKLC